MTIWGISSYEISISTQAFVWTYGCRLSFFLGIHLGLKLRDYMACVCWTFTETAWLFSCGCTTPPAPSSSCGWEPQVRLVLSHWRGHSLPAAVLAHWQWDLVMLICSFLMTNEAEHLSISYGLSIYFHLLLVVHLFEPFAHFYCFFPIIEFRVLLDAAYISFTRYIICK